MGSTAVLVLAACAGASAGDVPHAPIEPAPATHGETTPPVRPRAVRTVENTPITRGELPWWFNLEGGVYRLRGEVVVLGVGDSRDHHHIAEGFLQAKVTARLGVRRASESIRFQGTMPEPALEDLFVTRERRIYALYALRVPKDGELPPVVRALEQTIPAGAGRHRIGRHVFEGQRHLYLECEVEGPIANPDWGRTRAAARH